MFGTYKFVKQIAQLSSMCAVTQLTEDIRVLAPVKVPCQVR